ncbi:hypothetical protein [Rhizorhapis sp. SPR117]|uniref:hypothetical protein n=1 Tax=Rhizorhapis sp. SPR117 TaxID=2912611 RepID=UPI001F483025|nr:hypothetical protein [Rhizorhapis sp. SPR117]
MQHVVRTTFTLCMALLLSACLLTPGKFDSTLDIRADRSFTFTYKGEVIALDMAKEMGKGMGTPDVQDESWDDVKPSDSSFMPIAFSPEDDSSSDGTNADGSDDTADTETKMKAMAEALSKEAGYKSVQYVGGNKFLIDYEVHGTLDHSFVYPFNIDAEIVFPFIAVELCGRDVVRVKAPGFANDDKKGGMGGMGPPSPSENALNGTFTLTTNAEIISQNNENGVVAVPDGRKIVWTVTPLTKDEPMAVLKLTTLPGK